jgi:undecaprenyl-diphosphatase
MDIFATLSALAMGILEGLTEFLPISSTGHLILLGALIGFQGPPGKVFEISIQLGAILAVMWIYRGTLWQLATKMWHPGRERYYVANLAFAFLPAMVIGLTLHKTITEALFNPKVVCVALILGGIAIILIERFRPQPSIHSVPEMGPLSALLVGFGQALAMIPGTSRSGATIITALLLGVDRKTAAEFSFVLAIPTMLAATAYSLLKVRNEIGSESLTQIGIGFLAAFVVAFFTVRWVISVIGRIGFTPFGWYRIALGTIGLIGIYLI